MPMCASACYAARARQLSQGQTQLSRCICRPSSTPAPYQTGHEKIDPSRPLVPQVGALGPAYDEWTHQALPGIPRLFGPDWMEACSKTPWWLIPLIWIPLSTTCMVVAMQHFHVTGIALAWRAMVGFALWHFLEYVLHRFAFHLVPRSHAGITFHFLLHGIHHKCASLANAADHSAHRQSA